MASSDLSRPTRDLHKFAAAEEATRQAITLLEKLVDESPAVPDYRVLLADSHTELGVTFARQVKEFDVGAHVDHPDVSNRSTRTRSAEAA